MLPVSDISFRKSFANLHFSQEESDFLSGMSFVDIYARRNRADWRKAYLWKLSKVSHTLEPYLAAVSTGDRKLLEDLLTINRLPSDQHSTWLLCAIQTKNMPLLEEATRIRWIRWERSLSMATHNSREFNDLIISLVENGSRILTRFIVKNYVPSHDHMNSLPKERLDKLFDKIKSVVEHIPILWELMM